MILDQELLIIPAYWLGQIQIHSVVRGLNGRVNEQYIPTLKLLNNNIVVVIIIVVIVINNG